MMEPKYTISSSSNSKIKYIGRLQESRKFRHQEQAFVVEGARWVGEVVKAGIRPKMLLATSTWFRESNNLRLQEQLPFSPIEVSEELMAEVSDTATPSGVLAVLPMIRQPLPAKATLLLILDRISDPGNLGTIMRTTVASGVGGLLLSPGCVDAYNPKVVRSSMGAHLYVAMITAQWSEIASRVEGLAVRLASADARMPYYAADWRRPSALIIGSEATGPGLEARDLATEEIMIPMPGQAESLNAGIATGIILFEAIRQRAVSG
jgi:TrmH family RNA methyltransferase